MKVQNDRRQLYSLVALYGSLALGWAVFAGSVVRPLLTSEEPGRIVSAVKHYVESFPSPFIPRDIVGRWREFSGAVLLALVLHLTIVLFLRRYSLRSTLGRCSNDVPTDRQTNLLLICISLLFLAVTLYYGPIHDYFFYLNMWYEVCQGHDPWFMVFGINGRVPLNAYGPLFNVLAVLEWVNPLAPKLLFAYAYILFSVWQIKEFAASRRLSCTRLVVLTALFWNPFPWVEIAIRGHFDILVALFCLGAIRTSGRGKECPFGDFPGVRRLLKFFPVVLIPFLALDRGRIRWRFLFAAVATIALGMGLSYYLWGESTCASDLCRPPGDRTACRVFRFLRGRYSPLLWVTYSYKRGITWRPHHHVCRPAACVVVVPVRHPEIESACVIAVTTTALFTTRVSRSIRWSRSRLGAHAGPSRCWEVRRCRIGRRHCDRVLFWMARCIRNYYPHRRGWIDILSELRGGHPSGCRLVPSRVRRSWLPWSARPGRKTKACPRRPATGRRGRSGTRGCLARRDHGAAPSVGSGTRQAHQCRGYPGRWVCIPAAICSAARGKARP